MPKKKQSFADTFDKSATDYAYTDNLTNRDWAWEFLRRNPSYQKDAFASRLQRHRRVDHHQGLHLYRNSCQKPHAEKWGLARFADPRCNALNTDIFWIDREVKAQSQIHLSAFKPADLDLKTDQNLRALLLDEDGEHLAVCAHNQSAQVHLHGASILFSPIDLTFQLPGFDTIDLMFNSLKTLHILLKSSDRKPPRHSVKPLLKNQKQVLIALDCWQKSGSLQDTARLFQRFGLTRLEWSTSGNEALKKQIWRYRNKGVALMRDAYRTLL